MNDLPANFAELQRCQNQEFLDEIIGLLDQAKIPYHLVSTASTTGTAWMGFKDQGTVVVMVPAERVAGAREFMEERYLEDELPADHYLYSMSAEDLSGILADPDSWSAYDVAQTRRLAGMKGIKPVGVEQRRVEIMENRHKGKPAPRWLLGAALILAFLGPYLSILSMAIVWWIAYMKEKDAEGSFNTYNAASRRWAKGILALASVMTFFTLTIWLSSWYP